MSADLATLRALATSTVNASFAEARGWSDKCATALLLACDEIERLRATLARMPQPLQSLAAVAYAATRDPLTARAWNDLTQAARDVIAGRVRYGLDYLAGGDGNGTIYSASPGDPPPTQPPT